MLESDQSFKKRGVKNTIHYILFPTMECQSQLMAVTNYDANNFWHVESFPPYFASGLLELADPFTPK